jgi:hypothetical protein
MKGGKYWDKFPLILDLNPKCTELEAEVLSTIAATDLCGVNIVINIIGLVQVCNIFYLFDSKLIYRERNFLNKVFRVIGLSEGNSAKMKKILRKRNFQGKLSEGYFVRKIHVEVECTFAYFKI